MAVRLGIGAVLEELRGTGAANAMVPVLAGAMRDANPRDRADMAHFLSLIDTPDARQALQAYVDDADPDVRDIAREALE